MRSRSGFTLVELLITISIIAVLSAIALVSYTAFIKSSRDAKRQSDVKVIQSALEQYHADQKYYPSQDQVTPGSPLSFGPKTYMTKVPSDPSGSPNYSYQPSGTGYCLFAKLEISDPPDDQGCTPSADYNFGVTRP